MKKILILIAILFIGCADIQRCYYREYDLINNKKWIDYDPYLKSDKCPAYKFSTGRKRYREYIKESDVIEEYKAHARWIDNHKEEQK